MLKSSLNFKPLLILALVAFWIFLSVLWFSTGTGLFVSPDEAANAFFSEQFSASGRLSVFEPLNLVLSDILHPRSMISQAGRILPVSFLGLPVLYGALAAVFSNQVLPYLTPLIAFFAVLAWYGLIRRVFNGPIALLAGLLLAAHPAWWYYAARPLMHNVLFTSLLIFSAYFFLAAPLEIWFKKRSTALSRLADPFLAGIFFGLAVFVRSSEAFWLALGLVVIYFLCRRSVSWRAWSLFILGSALALLPMFYFQHETYGHFLATGYTVEVSGPDIPEPVPSASPAFANSDFNRAWQSLQDFIAPVLPFGLHPRNILRHVSDYGLFLFWWLSIFSLLGFLAWRRGANRGRLSSKTYFWSGLLAFVWLVMLYGSWAIHDNPDPAVLTLANSYVRYWLPIYVWSTPLAALGIIWISERFKPPRARFWIAVLLVAASFGLSLNLVYFTPGDGWRGASATLARSAQIKAEVLSLTEPDSIIIVDYADKIFFPERRVRVPLRSEATYRFMPAMLAAVPLYYYGITLPESDLAYLNEVKLPDNLRIELVQTFDAESLYRINQ